MRWLMAPAHYHASDARLAHPTALMPLEILHLALVLFRRRPRFEGAEIAALAGLRIDLSGIEPVLARSQFADHGTPPPSYSSHQSRWPRSCSARIWVVITRHRAGATRRPMTG